MRVQKPFSSLPAVLWLALVVLLLGLSGMSAMAAPPAQSTPAGTFILAQESETPLPPSATVVPTETPIPPACAIEGYVFNDLNRDQVRQDNEPGLQTTIFLLPAEGSDDPLASQVTDATGYFCFPTGSIPPGRYRLRQQKVTGYETTGGQDRLITVVANRTTVVSFANVEARATPTNAPTFTAVPTRETPTAGPTFTPVPPTSTQTPTASSTLPPSVTPSLTATGSVTPTPSLTPTSTASATATRTPTRTPTGTLRALTPIATFITTTPGVLVTTTRPAGSVPTPVIDHLPPTGSGSSLLLVATMLGILMLGAGLARRLFFGR